jgi:integrase
MTIKKLGNHNYFIRVTKYINGKKRERKFTGILVTAGAAKAKEAELDKELKDIKFKEENEALRYTWKKALVDYLNYSEDKHRLSTFYNRLKVLEKYTPSWDNRELNEISKTEVRELVENIPKTISFKIEVLKYIRQVFELACESHKLSFNPAKKIALSEDKAFRDKASQLSAMTKSEAATLFDYMKEIKHEWYEIFYITYQLGLRSSETVALQFKDLNFEKSHVVISKSWCKKKKGFVPPKNGTSRIVPMNKQLASFLKEKKLMTTSLDDFILPRNRSWMNGGATKVIHQLQDILGIKRTNYHSLRASFITHLLRDGLDITRVQAMVGHRELSTTQRYIRLDGTDLQGVTESLSIEHVKRGELIKFRESNES